jgi:hypothetical protein
VGAVVVGFQEVVGGVRGQAEVVVVGRRATGKWLGMVVVVAGRGLLEVRAEDLWWVKVEEMMQV